MQKADFVIRNARQVVTPAGVAPQTGRKMRVLTVIDNGAVASFNGKIVFVGSSEELKSCCNIDGAKVFDAKEKVVLPGFVDPHTHIVFGGFREQEFNRRIEGVSYEQIAEEGGGIKNTVKATRQCSEEELFQLAQQRLNQAIAHGTTTVEIKSGYGLSLKDELKILKVIRKLKETSELDIVSTFLGAHTVPAEYSENRDDYCRLVADEMLPVVAKENLAEFCDIFCEKGAFSVKESRTILKKAFSLGLKLKVHADQLSPSGASELACEVNAVSAEHLEYISEKTIKKFAEKLVSAVLLPGAAFFIRQGLYPPARKLIDGHAPVALATDCNPGSCYTTNMTMIMTLAVLEMGMTIEEAITASTLNAAYSINRDSSTGSLETGKNMDAVIMAIPNYYHLVYNWGINHVQSVIKKGKIIFSR